MKTFSLSILLTLFSLNSFAQTAACLGKFCMGDEIMDNYGYTGKVVGFVAEKNQIIYMINGNSSPDTAASANLAKKIDSLAFPIGKVVIDQYNYIGKVTAAYDNNKIIYLINGNSSTDTTNATNLVGTVPALNGLKVGDTIIDQYNYRGVIKMIFADGRMQYLINGNSSPDITKSTLTPTVESLGDLTLGTVVIDQYNYIGKIVTLFKDGRQEYLINGNSSTDITKSKLVPLVSSYQDLAPGITVIDQYNYIGTVQKTFADGRVQYLINGNSSPDITKATNLSVKSDATSTGLKAGMLAIDRYNYVGAILMTFKNGKIQFKQEDSSSPDIVTALSGEIETSPAGYSKSMEYASERADIGTPIHFFDNGKIQIIDGRGNKNIGSSLSPEVEGLSDLKKGDLVLLTNFKSYPVERIFENHTVVFSAPRSDTEGAPLTQQSMILISDPLAMDSIANLWILALRENDSPLGYYLDVRTAIKKSDYPALRAKILELLDKNNMGLSKKEIKQITSKLPETI